MRLWDLAVHYPDLFACFRASWSPVWIRVSSSQPRHSVRQPGSPSPLRPRKPPSLATACMNWRTVSSAGGGGTAFVSFDFSFDFSFDLGFACACAFDLTLTSISAV